MGKDVLVGTVTQLPANVCRQLMYVQDRRRTSALPASLIVKLLVACEALLLDSCPLQKSVKQFWNHESMDNLQHWPPSEILQVPHLA